jgi:hypothetical protein
MRRRHFFVAFAVAALLLAGLVSSVASSSPDGLERVAQDNGMAAEEQEHAMADSPLAGYGIGAIDSELLSGGLAGVLGVGVVLALTAGLTLALRRRADQDHAGRGS